MSKISKKKIRRILIAPDSFKGSLTSQQFCETACQAIAAILPDVQCTTLPLADGGEGALQVVAACTRTETIRKMVPNALGQSIFANYLFEDETATAYIELAQASGLAHLPANKLNAMQANTRGTGILIADALQRGARNITLFVGGSATTDGALGILSEMGFRFYNKEHRLLAPTGAAMAHIATYEKTENLLITQVRFRIAADVNNPFYGKQGAAFVYAAQKGADRRQQKMLDNGLQHWADLLKQNTGIDLQQVAGSGAAGGVAGALHALLDGEIVNGADLLFDLTDLETHLKNVDLLITGEGKLDEQTLHDKLLFKICQKATNHQVPVWIFPGQSTCDTPCVQKLGAQRIIPLVQGETTPDEAMKNAATLLDARIRAAFAKIG